MAWKDESHATFTGGSGQMAVIGELLHRKCNAAIPHVDVGMDVFAFQDDREELARIQVKTAPGEPYKKGKGYHVEFRIPIDQLKRTDAPPLFYALTVRLANGWGSFIVISRDKLQKMWAAGCGSNSKSGKLKLYVQYRPDEATAENEQKLKALCGKFDLTDYLNAWESLPPLKPIPALDADTATGVDAAKTQA